MHVIIGARFLLAETHRSLAQYEDAEGLYIKCMNDLEDDQFNSLMKIRQRSTLHLYVLTGMADLYRNIGLIEEATNVLYKAAKVEGTTSPQSMTDLKAAGKYGRELYSCIVI